MNQRIVRILFSILVASYISILSDSVNAEPSHGIAMHGKPALPGDFNHLPYVNPDAPKGGKITYGVRGNFDSLNPFIIKSIRTTARGVWDPVFGNLVYESLLHRSRDEAFTLYGLLAETVETGPERTWIEFHLNPKARFSDGKPVTVDDVMFSFKLMQEKGRPPYSSRMKKVASMEKVGERGVRFNFTKEADRELALLFGMMPILPKHATDAENFGKSTLKPQIGSGPYVVSKIKPGESISYKRNPDYWAKDLPVKVGQDNYDTIKIEYFTSSSSMFEAFKKGLFDVFPEGDPSKWQNAYDFPAVNDGRITKDVFHPKTPASMLGFVFNTRRKIFSDRNVRHALSMLFDFEWANTNLFFGAYKRTGSYYHGSELSALGIPASEAERALLAPYPNSVSKDVMEGTYLPSISDGSGRDRKVLKQAFGILKKAGFKLENRKMMTPDGKEFQFEILTTTKEQERLALAWQRTLARLGIALNVRSVDDTQFQRRKGQFDYDVVIARYYASLSPGAEQEFRWGSATRNIEGSFNFAGTAEPSIDAMIKAMLAARKREDFITAVRAFDRVLISGHYLVPLYHLNEQWVARWTRIQHPEKLPLYGYRLPTWWAKTGD